MCLAIPMRLVERAGDTGLLELDGVRREVLLTLCPEAEIGDYLLVHAGYAIGKLDAEEALLTLQLLEDVARHSEGRHGLS
jgi:hydrogenase expression/formation protein HypC